MFSEFRLFIPNRFCLRVERRSELWNMQACEKFLKTWLYYCRKNYVQILYFQADWGVKDKLSVKRFYYVIRKFCLESSKQELD